MLNFLLVAAMFAQPADVAFYGGTIIVMQKDDKRFIVVADSRASNQLGAYWDDTCKIEGLGDKALFFATGRTLLASDDGKTIFFNINDVVQRVFNDFSRFPNDENRLNLISFYSALFVKSYIQEIAAQKPVAFLDGIKSGNLVKAIVGGTLNDGSLVGYLIKINGKPASTTVPLISFTVEKWSEPSGDNVAIFGSDENNGVTEFLGNKTEPPKSQTPTFKPRLQGPKMLTSKFCALNMPSKVPSIGRTTRTWSVVHWTSWS